MKWSLAVLGLASIAALSLAGQRATRPPDLEWPLELGTLEQVPIRHPMQSMNASAKVLSRLARSAGIELESGRTGQPSLAQMAITNWTNRQLQFADDRIDPPDERVREYLREHESAIGAVREFLLAHRDIRFEEDIERAAAAPLPNLSGRSRLSRALVAHALDAIARRDRVASDDLQAAWNLQRDLWKRPELVSAMVALAGTRLATAAARKLPARPAWLGEVEAFDVRRAIAAAQQGETWIYRQAADEAARSKSADTDLFDWILEPYELAVAGNVAVVIREATHLALRSRGCAFDTERYQYAVGAATPWWNRAARRGITNLAQVWARANRFRAERELTSRVLALKAGQKPAPRSECTDGAWLVEGKRIRFTREIPIPTWSATLKVPLSYSVK